MTLAELIVARAVKFESQDCITQDAFNRSWCLGWRAAYEDLRDILEQNGFDLDQVVVEDK